MFARKQTSFIKASSAFAFGLCASVLAAESLLHLIEATPLWHALPIVERELGMADETLGYRFRINHQIINIRENRASVRTNSHGMRDSARTLEKPASRYRIAVFGDSFTEALQVKQTQTFLHLAERRINHTKRPAQVELLNFGMSGFGPLQQLLHYQTTAEPFTPNQSLFIVNARDFLTEELSNDASGPAYIETTDGGFSIGDQYRNSRVHRLKDTAVGRLFFWLMDHSRVARAVFLKYRIGAVDTAPQTHLPATQTCQQIAQQLLAHARLWSENKPQNRARRIEKLLHDFQRSQIIKPSFAIYGLPIAPVECATERRQRDNIVADISHKLRDAGIHLIDIEAAVGEHIPMDLSPRQLLGFGVATGGGHLNVLGHEVWSKALTAKIQALID
ncbi:MAG: hypothetical protein AAF387_01820 [Pseudomonadota bacterium]